MILNSGGYFEIWLYIAFIEFVSLKIFVDLFVFCCVVVYLCYVNQYIKSMYHREYLNLEIERKDGTTFRNPLQLSEVHLISKIAQDKDTVKITVTIGHCISPAQYKSIFG